MKNTLLTALFAVITTISFAQNNGIDKYFSKYKTEDVTKVHITGKMFELLAELDNESDDEAVKMLQGVKEFNAIIAQESKTAKSDYNQATQSIGREFDELMAINDKDGNATFYINEADGIISEMLMIAHGQKEFIVVSITGNINLKAVSKIMKEAHMHDYMKKTTISNMDEFKIYPNPVPTNSPVNVDVPEGLLGSQYQIFDLQGKEVKSGKINDRHTQISTSGLAKGKYLIKIAKDDFDISKKLLIE